MSDANEATRSDVLKRLEKVRGGSNIPLESSTVVSHTH